MSLFEVEVIASLTAVLKRAFLIKHTQKRSNRITLKVKKGNIPLSTPYCKGLLVKLPLKKYKIMFRIDDF